MTDGKPAAWDATLTGTQRYYAYKRFAAGEGNCTNPSGYGEPIAVATAPVIRDPIGSADGYYFLCVICRRHASGGFLVAKACPRVGPF